MGARQKLNTHHIAGAVGVAGILGLITGSWLVAAVVGTLAIGMARTRRRYSAEGPPLKRVPSSRTPAPIRPAVIGPGRTREDGIRLR